MSPAYFRWHAAYVRACIIYYGIAIHGTSGENGTRGTVREVSPKEDYRTVYNVCLSVQPVAFQNRLELAKGAKGGKGRGIATKDKIGWQHRLRPHGRGHTFSSPQ